jgi:hypothetical protein
MAIFLISVGAIGILIFILPYLLISANPFLQPSGKWHVGTTDLIWDKPDLSGIIGDKLRKSRVCQEGKENV